MGFWELLTLVLVVLKLCHVIAWPWLYVFAPVLIELAIFVVVWLVTLVGVGIIAYLGSR